MIEVERPHHRLRRARRCSSASTSTIAARRGVRDPRRQRLRQVDAAAPPDRPRDADGRHDPRRRRAAGAGHRRRRRFGVLFQSGALFGSMTLAQNVALPLAHVDRPRRRRDRHHRARQAAPGRPRGLREPPAGGALRRHEEARRHRARARARPAAAVPRRAVGGPRPGELGRARRADLDAEPQPRHDHRHRHARACRASSRSPSAASCSTATPAASSPAATRASCAITATIPRVRAFFNRQARAELMATTATNHWKLGLFVVVGVVALIGGALLARRAALPARRRSRP